MTSSGPGMTSKHKTADIRTIAEMSVEQCAERLAELSKGLAHPARVKIIRMLANKSPDSKCVCGEIVGALSLAQSTVSQHLKMLKETGWIQGEIERPHVCYYLVDDVFEYYTVLSIRSLGREF